MTDWLADHPDVRSVTAAIADLHGQARGKRMPSGFADKILSGATRLPLSALNVDILGDDIEDSPLVFETGDQDGVLRPTDRGFVPMPWLASPAALIPVWMYTDSGTPFPGDPRHALSKVLGRFAAHGWNVTAATELEFYLVDDSGETLRAPMSPRSGKRRLGGEVYALRALDAFDAFFTELYDACTALRIPAEAATSESGLAQYEINLTHVDAMKAADDAWLFKLLVKGLARKHGMAATFMAKPYPEQPGNGMHVHFSVSDDTGANVFDDGSPLGTDTLRHAIGGCLSAMADQTLIFAPHGNSFERFAPGNHAPTGIGWGYENRTVAIRVPSGPPSARRIEHRVAGGDVNPYLLLAAILGAALHGMEARSQVAEPISGSAYTAKLDRIPSDWSDAITRFAKSDRNKDILGEDLVRNFTMTKRQEHRADAALAAQERIDLYLDTV